MTPNPSIERTSSGKLRLSTAAAHVERQSSVSVDHEQLLLFGKIVLGAAVAVGLWFAFRPSTGGWGSLSERFGVTELPDGQRFSGVSGMIGEGLLVANYQRMWTAVVNSAGFGLSLRSVFGKAPSIFIPWSTVRSVVETEAQFLGATSAVVRIHGQTPPISLWGAPGKAVAQAYGRSHSAPAL